MNHWEEWARSARDVGILVDTNLLVLFVVGSVNRKRIESFKRTSSFIERDYDLLRELLGDRKIYSLAHILSEVSNLADLSGSERSRARQVLREAIRVITEPVIPSWTAAQNSAYERLGLTDAAIIESARAHRCAVLTNDLDLALALERQQLPAVNFTHYRTSVWGL